MALRSKYRPYQMVLLPEVIFVHNLFTFDHSPYLQFGQNVLLNDRSLRTFASLTSKYDGSFMRVFTVYLSIQVIPGNLQKHVSTSRTLLRCKALLSQSSVNPLANCLLKFIRKQNKWQLCLQKGSEYYCECL